MMRLADLAPRHADLSSCALVPHVRAPRRKGTHACIPDTATRHLENPGRARLNEGSDRPADKQTSKSRHRHVAVLPNTMAKRSRGGVPVRYYIRNTRISRFHAPVAMHARVFRSRHGDVMLAEWMEGPVRSCVRCRSARTLTHTSTEGPHRPPPFFATCFPCVSCIQGSGLSLSRSTRGTQKGQSKRGVTKRRTAGRGQFGGGTRRGGLGAEEGMRGIARCAPVKTPPRSHTRFGRLGSKRAVRTPLEEKALPRISATRASRACVCERLSSCRT